MFGLRMLCVVGKVPTYGRRYLWTGQTAPYLPFRCLEGLKSIYKGENRPIQMFSILLLTEMEEEKSGKTRNADIGQNRGGAGIILWALTTHAVH